MTQKTHVTLCLDKKGNPVAVNMGELFPVWNWRAAPKVKETAVVATVTFNPDNHVYHGEDIFVKTARHMDVFTLGRLEQLKEEHELLNVLGNTRRWKDIDPTHLTVYYAVDDVCDPPVDIISVLGLDNKDWHIGEKVHHWSLGLLGVGHELRWMKCATLYKEGYEPGEYKEVPLF